MSEILLFKIVLVLLLVFIIFNLGRALFVLVRGEGKAPMSQYLGRRVLFSVLVVLILLIALGLGIIAPNPRPY
ncbi:DUF2909 domain-containing protein [Shewanella marisflavi]|uniref:DUF2909 domain-containing protein n=1 Tax=Shewanella marisflavi TaxID=260364 RepID=UPI00200FB739|nr:DUF2909 domain-containing protein [Shewanella marisflavi]MCL1043055.1 DUF2909 domain-containing protein [Shewanella marisflavi]